MATTEKEGEKEEKLKTSATPNNTTTATAPATAPKTGDDGTPAHKGISEFHRNCDLYWKPLFSILVPLIFLPLVLYPYKTHEDKLAGHGAYGTIVIVIYWVTEALPLAITSFLPVTLYPLLGVANSHKFVGKYFNDSIMIFTAGLFIAIGFEFSNLHKRIALKVIISIGASPGKLLLGIMLTTATLSMWMSNTAITALLLNQTLNDEYTSEMTSVETLNVNGSDVQATATGGEGGAGVGGGGGPPKIDPNASTTSVTADKAQAQATKRKGNKTNPNLNLKNPNIDSQLQLRAKTSATKIGGAFDKLTNTKVQPETETDPTATAPVKTNDQTRANAHLFGRASLSPSDASLIPKASTLVAGLDINGIEAKRKLRVSSLNVLIANMKKMFLLSTAYAANLGGTAMITGSGTNFVAKNAFEAANVGAHCDGDRSKFGFVQWAIFNFLPFVLNMIFAYAFLVMWFTKRKPKKAKTGTGGKDVDNTFTITPAIVKNIRDSLETTYKNYGKRSVHETGVFVIFMFTVLLWVFHDPDVFPGWSSFFEASKPSLASAGLAGALFLFVIPKNLSFYKALRRRDFTDIKFEALLEWRYTQTKFPWGVIMVLGGGFALSHGVNSSGLGALIGKWLGILRELPKEAMLLVVIYLTSFITEVASNTAVASILVPVLLDISRKFKIHPMYLSLPSTIASSYSFMLPVATPPNAIVYSAGKMKMKDMLIPGFVMNIASGAILFVSTLSWGLLVYNFGDYKLNPALECNPP